MIAFQDGTRPFVGCCESPRFCCPQLVSRRTRLVIANVPNNPTGWLPSHDEWLRCAARRLGRAVLCRAVPCHESCRAVLCRAVPCHESCRAVIRAVIRAVPRRELGAAV